MTDESVQPFRIYSLSDLVRDPDLAEFLAGPELPGAWGPWRLDPDTYVLYLPHYYEVDLERCRTSAEMLDWIFQVSLKGWDRYEGRDMNAITTGLIVALDDVLEPQANLCSFGASKRLSRKRIRALVDSAIDRGRVVIDPERPT